MKVASLAEEARPVPPTPNCQLCFVKRMVKLFRLYSLYIYSLIWSYDYAPINMIHIYVLHILFSHAVNIKPEVGCAVKTLSRFLSRDCSIPIIYNIYRTRIYRGFKTPLSLRISP